MPIQRNVNSRDNTRNSIVCTSNLEGIEMLTEGMGIYS